MATSLVVKMDPMVRKLESNLSQFKQALEDEDLVAAQQLLRAISQTSDYLADDVTEIYKSEISNNQAVGPNDMYAGGVPVMQFNKIEYVSETQERPLGIIAPNRIGSRFQPHRYPGTHL